MPNILITGAASGIGLSLTKLFLTKHFNVFATVRHPSPELIETDAHIINNINLENADSISSLSKHLTNIKLDILINCAGILTNESLPDLHFDRLLTQFNVNALGPLRITQQLLPHLKDGSKIAMITSRMGSIEDNTSGSRYGYRMAKAALNAASKSLAIDLKPRGIAVAIIHPGLVSTKMIGFNGDITPAIAANRIYHRIDALNITNSGTFWHSDGSILPW